MGVLEERPIGILEADELGVHALRADSFRRLVRRDGAHELHSVSFQVRRRRVGRLFQRLCAVQGTLASHRCPDEVDHDRLAREPDGTQQPRGHLG